MACSPPHGYLKKLAIAVDIGTCEGVLDAEEVETPGCEVEET